MEAYAKVLEAHRGHARWGSEGDNRVLERPGLRDAHCEKAYKGMKASPQSAGLPKPFGAQVIPLWAPDTDMELQEMVFNPAGLQSCFGLIFPHCASISPFWNRDVGLVPLDIRDMQLFKK